MDTDRFARLLNLAADSSLSGATVSLTVLSACVQHPEWARAWYEAFLKVGFPVQMAGDELIRMFPVEVYSDC